MRIIVIRHGQTLNNILQETSFETYEENRKEDTKLSQKGEEDAIKLGKFLKENEFKINKMYLI